MRRALALVLCVVLVSAAVVVTSCGNPKGLARAFWRYVDGHGHVVQGWLDRVNLGYIYLMFVVTELDNDEDYPLSTSSAWIPPPLEPPDEKASLSIADTAANPFFDHALDGVWHGRSRVYFEGGYGKSPFLMLANGSQDQVYLSFVFQDIHKCLAAGEPHWTAVYTGEVELNASTGELHFDRMSSSWLAPSVPDVADLDFSYSSYPSRDRFHGQGRATHGRRRQPVFETRDEFVKVKRTRGVTGLWSSGFTSRIYAGELLDPPLFHPAVMSLLEGPNGLDLDLYVLFSQKEGIFPMFDGQRLRFDFWTPNGPSDSEFVLQRDKLVGRAWDNLSDSYLQLTFTRAGISGKTPKVKRVKPRTLALGTAGRGATLTVIGRDFAPGSMIFFSEPDIRIESIDFVSKKKLKVRIAAADGLPRGTAVDVMVLGPDNRSAERARAFRTR